MKISAAEETAFTTFQICLEKIFFVQIDRIEPTGVNLGADFQVWVRVQGQSHLENRLVQVALTKIARNFASPEHPDGQYQTFCVGQCLTI